MSLSTNSPQYGFQPNAFIINACTLTPTGGEPIDLRVMFNDLNVWEDIWGNGITAALTIVDSLNLIKNLPIFGYETVHLSFQTPSNPATQYTPFDHVFRVYRIEQRQLTKERQQVYVLHMVSLEVFTDQQVRVSKSYNGMLISDIVTDLQKNWLNSSFFAIDPTIYPQQIVVPNLHPMEMIRLLSTRANAAAYPGSNYLYYENQDGYHFDTLEKLVQQVEAITYAVHPANNFKYLSSKYIPQIVTGVESYKFLNHIDTLESQMRGMYGSRLITHNIGRKRFFQQDFNYPASYPMYDHLEPNNAKNDITGQSGLTFLSDQEETLSSPNNLLRFYPSGLGFEDFPNQVEQWIQERISRLQQFHTIHLEIRAPGDSRRKAGEKVEFLLPSPEPLVNNELQNDIYYSGAYLITGIRHLINRSQYVNLIELKKDSTFEPYP